MRDIYRGKLTRLAAEPAEILAKAYAHWAQDSEYVRLADSDPARLWSEKKRREWIEKQMEQDPPRSFLFSIRTLADDRLIGDVGILPDGQHADAWVGIAIGERDLWGRGYGTDAMQLIVQYGFLELNLQRVSLALHSYNTRALKSYEKVGFKVEGAIRGEIVREGRRTDTIFMGILRPEWLALQGGVS